MVSQERQRIVAKARQSRVQELRIEAEEAGTCLLYMLVVLVV